MGNTPSKKDDEEHLIPAYTQMYEQLKLVVIGCYGAGKNDVGNTILGKRAFMWWTTWSKTCKKGKRKTPQGNITVYRAPGWSEDKSLEDSILQIQTCLRDTPKHAIILVINVKTSFNPKQLKTIVDRVDKFWDHTIVLFTYVDNGNIEDYIKKLGLQNCFPDNHNRRCSLRSEHVGRYRSQTIEMFEDMITQKNSLFFTMESDGGPEEFILHFKKRIAELKSKLKIMSQQNKSQKETIEKLERKLKEKEEKLVKCLWCHCHIPQLQIADIQKPKELKQENTKLSEHYKTNLLDHDANKRQFATQCNKTSTRTPTKEIEMGMSD